MTPTKIAQAVWKTLAPGGRILPFAAVLVDQSWHSYIRIVSALPVVSSSAQTPHIAELTMEGIERINSAEFIPPGTILIEFIDRRRFTLQAEALGMPMNRIDWPTLAISPGREKIVVKGIKGDQVPIDAATLRYLVDKTYAVKMDAKLRSLQFTDEELEQLNLDEPPAGFLEQPNQINLTRESWK